MALRLVKKGLSLTARGRRTSARTWRTISSSSASMAALESSGSVGMA